jgi:predicted alpha/beta hydrolase family esterase
LLQKPIYYLPGRGGRLDTGLGLHLLQKGYDLTGRALVDDFNKLSFAEQVDTVAQDLRANFWNASAQIIANSFGAYLFLHAQIQLTPFPGKVLLLSPIVGESSNEGRGASFIPPRATQLLELAESGKYPKPLHCQMHVGSEDWQCNPENVQKLATLIRAEVFIVDGAGHNLPKSYVGELLDKWLT